MGAAGGGSTVDLTYNTSIDEGDDVYMIDRNNYHNRRQFIAPSLAMVDNTHTSTSSKLAVCDIFMYLLNNVVTLAELSRSPLSKYSAKANEERYQQNGAKAQCNNRVYTVSYL
jgi:hypothetical protein